MHEEQLHEESCFVTLTYDDEHLPADGSLNKRHFQLFMKRLRKHFHGERTRNLSQQNNQHAARQVRQKEKGQRIRFFHCGEYGESFDRPHYHACLFGVHFCDQLFFRCDNGNDLYTSETLNRLWGKGFCIIGQLTFESAAYVARYCVKKVTGHKAQDHYYRDCPITGQMRILQPEYATMSRRPGIARDWFDEYENDVYPWDEVVSRGHPAKPPRYYDKLLEERNPELFGSVQLQRELNANAKDSTPQRLAAREKVKEAQLTLLTRGYEK